jgi:hypothetical protein
LGEQRREAAIHYSRWFVNATSSSLLLCASLGVFATNRSRHGAIAYECLEGIVISVSMLKQHMYLSLPLCCKYPEKCGAVGVRLSMDGIYPPRRKNAVRFSLVERKAGSTGDISSFRRWPHVKGYGAQSQRKHECHRPCPYSFGFVNAEGRARSSAGL